MACIFCASKAHDYRSCPLGYALGKAPTFKQDYFGKAPNVFIGRHGYPRVRVGVLGVERYEGHDDPLAWSKDGATIARIVRLRSELVNSYVSAPVQGQHGGLVGMTKDVSLAKRPVDVEINLAKTPTFRLTPGEHAAPHGPNVALRQARVTENIPVDTKVEKAASATDFKAGDALAQLGRRGVDPYFLAKAFSMGNFGLATERKLVPTRWSITAVDDIMAKEKIGELKQWKEADCTAHFGGHLGNEFLILFFDDVWQYELFEQHASSGQAWTDHEPYAGRKEYAKETAGGYYASRLGVVEHLHGMRRQSAVLVLRTITDEYTVPLGVWVVREAVKKALAQPPLAFGDRRLMLEYAKKLLMRKFSIDLAPTLSRSHLVKSLFGQKKLSEY